MTAAQYTPRFRNDVFIVCPPGVAAQFPNGTQWPVNRMYCLRDDSAGELLTVLSDLNLIIVQAPPLGPMWRFYTSSTVAWFQAPDGTLLNAADLAMWWVRADPVTAERTARLEFSVAQKEHQDAMAQAQGMGG